MDDEIYFEGDPATDSTRRHLERVLKPQPRRRWPWYLALFTSGTAFAIWRMRARRNKDGDRSAGDKPSGRSR